MKRYISLFKDTIILQFIFVIIGICVSLFLSIYGIVFYVLWVMFFLFFFRESKIYIDAGDNAILSPAYGKIIAVESATEDTILKCDVNIVVIFMSIFDIHYNYAPIGGKIEFYGYFPGSFVSAFKKDRVLANERNMILISNRDKRLIMSQIAGFIARRIVFEREVGDNVAMGDRIGLIRFGSAVAIFIPEDSAKINVKVGDRVRAGQTVIGEWI